MQALEQIIDYTFKQNELLVEALTHSSYGYEHQCAFNERLEFLGDSILGYVISHQLYCTFPRQHEGHLSKLKSVLVSSQNLAEKAREIQLGDYLRLGKGESKGGGREKGSILADAMEALIGAVELDGGLEASRALILKLYKNDIKGATLDIKNSVDFKTLLQEKLQEQGLGLPRYATAGEEGPAHDRRFQIRVSVAAHEGPVGIGTSKKNAQQECARLLLEDEHFWTVRAQQLSS